MDSKVTEPHQIKHATFSSDSLKIESTATKEKMIYRFRLYRGLEYMLTGILEYKSLGSQGCGGVVKILQCCDKLLTRLQGLSNLATTCSHCF